MLKSVPKKWYVLRDRNEWADGDPEALALFRVPDMAGGFKKTENVEIENIGDTQVDSKGAKVQYRGSCGDSTQAHWTFVWGKDGDESFTAEALMDGRYGNKGDFVGKRKFMTLTDIDPAEAENLVALDTLDYYDCVGMKSKDGSPRVVSYEMKFQGRDPLGKKEEE